MKKNLRKLALIIVFFVIIVETKTVTVMAQYSIFKSEATSFITMEEYIVMLAKAVDSKVKLAGNKEYIDYAVNLGIIKKSEKSNLKKQITRIDAAVYGNRLDEIIYGKTYNKSLYDKVISKKRISDLDKITKEKRVSAVKMFIKGIMIGTSNGRYSQSRKFEGTKLLKKSEAALIVKRISSKAKRRKLSFDGQLIRVKNLPKNYKNYKYILESFPNSFYEMKFRYEKVLTEGGLKLKEYEDYVRPVNIRNAMFNEELGYTEDEIINLYLDNWCHTIEDNLKYRFNVNYKTINDKWINSLRNTYYNWPNDAEENKKELSYIKSYVQNVKKYKIIIKADKISVEPSTLYDYNGEYIRAYVKFKIISYAGDIKKEDLFYARAINIKDIKKGKTIEVVLDIGIGSKNGYSKGDDYAIVDNSLYEFY